MFLLFISNSSVFSINRLQRYNFFEWEKDTSNPRFPPKYTFQFIETFKNHYTYEKINLDYPFGVGGGRDLGAEARQETG
jgi:hypothetical protein